MAPDDSPAPGLRARELFEEENLQLFPEDAPASLTPEQEACKRQIYESMSPRRRKFVDRIGYEAWDPFQAPNDPLDIRKDATGRPLEELVGEFMRAEGGAARSRVWKKGALDCALGIIRKDEKYQGIFDFCMWYARLLRKEGQSR